MFNRRVGSWLLAWLIVMALLPVGLIAQQTAINMAEANIVDSLYRALKDPNVIDKGVINLLKPYSQPAQAAAAQGLYCEKVTDTTAATTSWVDVCQIAASSFTASKQYLIIANSYISSNNATNEARIRLVYGTTPTVFTDASAAYELTAVAAGTGNRTVYSYMTVYTQPSTANLVKLQISNSSTSTTTAEMGQIFALKLSDDFTENTDWCYAEQTTDYTTEAAFSDTSSTDAASCSLTADGTDDYLALANAMVDITSTASQYRMSLYESVSNVDEPALDIEGEDATNEFRSHVLAQTYLTPSAASHLWQPRFNDESTAYTILSSRIFVINLNKFSQHTSSYATAEEAPAATPNWTTTRTIAPTPDVTGDWFVLGTYQNDVGALTNDLFSRLQINPAGGGLASNPAYGDDAPHENSWDATDVTNFQIFKMISLSSGAARDINLGVQMNSGTTLRVQERHLVAFSLELPGAVPLGVTAPADVTLTAGNPGTTIETTFGTGELVAVTYGSLPWSLTVQMTAALTKGSDTIPTSSVKLRTDGIPASGDGTGDTYTIWSGVITFTNETTSGTYSLDTTRTVGTRSSGTGGDVTNVRPTIQVVMPPGQVLGDYINGNFRFTVA